MKLCVAQNKQYFEREDGSPVFLLADTCWSGITHPTDEEWGEYLDTRRGQGFNAVHINLLPQRHAGVPKQWLHPFAVTPENRYDYSQINEAYFAHARRRVQEVVNRGMLPMLVLLWGNFAPGTWQGKRDEGRENVFQRPYYLPMPTDAMQAYVQYAVGVFKEFDPVFMVSGDTNFSSDEMNMSGEPTPNNKLNRDTEAFYALALETAKGAAPECLCTLHILPLVTLPDSLIQAPELDFYMYQPGHTIALRNLDSSLAQHILGYGVKRPVINSETSYEGNIYFDAKSGRFDERQVRRSFWRGVLSGAVAGFSYGAAGVWQWKNRGLPTSITDHSGLVNNWRDDMQLPGAWDVSFGAWLLAQNSFGTLQPAPGLVDDDPCGEAVGAVGDGVALVYASFTMPLLLNMDLTGWHVELVDLEKRRVLTPVCRCEGGKTLVEPPACYHDVLLVARREG